MVFFWGVFGGCLFVCLFVSLFDFLCFLFFFFGGGGCIGVFLLHTLWGLRLEQGIVKYVRGRLSSLPSEYQIWKCKEITAHNRVFLNVRIE